MFFLNPRTGRWPTLKGEEDDFESTTWFPRVTAELPKMVSSQEELVYIEQVAEITNIVLTANFWIFMALNIILSSALSQIWNIFNTL